MSKWSGTHVGPAAVSTEILSATGNCSLSERSKVIAWSSFGHAVTANTPAVKVAAATMRSRIGLTLLILSSAITLHAQDRVVQQPVIRQMRVGTSVSVPDRGRAFLGGVSQGATSTKRFGGPFRSGTNTGREFSNSSQSVSVYIHDFEAMDAALLNAAEPLTPRPKSDRPLNPRAAHAWESLRTRPAGRR